MDDTGASDFDFLRGDWLVRHRTLAARLVGSERWDTFDGTMTSQPILGGQGNIDDNVLDTQTGRMRAAALRAFDPATRLWSIWWLSSTHPTTLGVPCWVAFTAASARSTVSRSSEGALFEHASFGRERTPIPLPGSKPIRPTAAQAGKQIGRCRSGGRYREVMLMHIQYLEIVTTDVDTACILYAKIHSVTFGSPDPNLGNARVADLANGGLLGIRAPMHDAETPVVRPYILVPDIEAAVAAAASCGAEIIVPPMKITGRGSCAILYQHGIQSGLWQL